MPAAAAGSPLTEEQGQALVGLARQTIAERLGRAIAGEERDRLETALADPIFRTRRATFVTLKINGQLRGCIGSLVAEEPLADSVRRNAINAAFGDPRFAPLAESELDLVRIEVSILTDPRPLDYRDGSDLAARLRPGIDGVIIRRGMQSATFLPQVWAQLPGPELFLAHLCQKAFLPADAWRHGDLAVETYQVQHFEE